MSNTRINNIFRGMQQRCTNPKVKEYKYYGGRGIRCLWDTFEEFYKDMAGTYSDTLTIERNNVDGDYCKENCCWIPQSEQLKNTRRSKKYLLIKTL